VLRSTRRRSEDEKVLVTLKSLSRVLVVVIAGLAFLATIWTLGNRWLHHSEPEDLSPQSVAQPSRGQAATLPSSDVLLNRSVHGVDADGNALGETALDIFSDDVEDDFNALFTGKIRIDDFIRHHEALAESGRADSMHFVAEAMKDCVASMSMVQPLIDKIAQERGATAARPADYRELVEQEKIGNSEFAVEEWSRRIDRAYACLSLNRDISTLGNEFEQWESLAIENGQPIAVTTFITTGLQSKSTEDLQRAKNVIREQLASNKSLEIILAAEDLSAFLTGREGPAERLAWSLLACEYYDCNSRLSYRYRTTCEIDAHYGDIYCKPGMTDYEFLRAKLPEHYDVATGRAMELKQHLDQDLWDLLGL